MSRIRTDLDMQLQIHHLRHLFCSKTARFRAISHFRGLNTSNLAQSSRFAIFACILLSLVVAPGRLYLRNTALPFGSTLACGGVKTYARRKVILNYTWVAKSIESQIRQLISRVFAHRKSIKPYRNDSYALA